MVPTDIKALRWERDTRKIQVTDSSAILICRSNWGSLKQKKTILVNKNNGHTKY